MYTPSPVRMFTHQSHLHVQSPQPFACSYSCSLYLTQPYLNIPSIAYPRLNSRTRQKASLSSTNYSRTNCERGKLCDSESIGDGTDDNDIDDDVAPLTRCVDAFFFRYIRWCVLCVYNGKRLFLLLFYLHPVIIVPQPHVLFQPP